MRWQKTSCGSWLYAWRILETTHAYAVSRGQLPEPIVTIPRVVTVESDSSVVLLTVVVESELFPDPIVMIPSNRGPASGAMRSGPLLHAATSRAAAAATSVRLVFIGVPLFRVERCGSTGKVSAAGGLSQSCTVRSG